MFEVEAKHLLDWKMLGLAEFQHQAQRPGFNTGACPSSRLASLRNSARQMRRCTVEGVVFEEQGHGVALMSSILSFHPRAEIFSRPTSSMPALMSTPVT